MKSKLTDKEVNKAIRETENELKKTKQKKETKMKTLTINPQVKGAFKTVVFIAIVAVAFYFGTQYQQGLHDKVTIEATNLVSQLKSKAQ